MTDPITAALYELAAHQEQITQLDERETGHFTTLTEHLAELTSMIATLTPDDAHRYEPDPPPPWWKLAAADRAEHLARLRAWVEQVYRPGYGHLAATLARAGKATTCACTPWTSPRPCGRSFTSSPNGPPACYRPRPNTRPASCPPWPPS